jgi:hypothetical protein
MEIKKMIQRQMGSSLLMLEEAIRKCPEPLWNSPDYKNRFWHIAYHTVFYAHLYLQDSDKSFEPWPKHRVNYQYLGRVPWPPHDQPRINEPYGKNEVLEYLGFCKNEVENRIPPMRLEAESGFFWLPFSKLELQLYNIRHTQHHTGQLIDRLRTKEDIEVPWVAIIPEEGA